MLFDRTLFFAFLFIALPAQAAETPWQGALHDGSQITIDPDTNKASRTWEGETSLLWDGVHQLDNGAVIIVRDGVVVKDASIIQEQKEQQLRQLSEACDQLVRKVCGPRNECDSHPACDPARQLLALERDELRNEWSAVVPESSRQCLEALSNESFFETCTKRSASTPLSPCEKLQQRVCGRNNQCGDSQACDAANQLVDMERNDRYASPSGYTYASGQCRGVLNDEGFFHACR